MSECNYIVQPCPDVLFEHLECDIRMLFTRHLFYSLGCDETMVGRYRIDHKWAQYRFLQARVPALVPKTMLLREIISHIPSHLVDQYIEQQFPDDYVIKPCIGYASRERNVLLGRANLKEIIDVASQQGSMCKSDCLLESDYIVQEKLTLCAEYRVHSFQQRVMPLLVFRQFNANELPDRVMRQALTAFIESVLACLPTDVTDHLFAAWDVAATPEGFRIIEMNPAGLHPTGYQCSGYFFSARWGLRNQALLVRSIEMTSGCVIEIPYLATAERAEGECYREAYDEIRFWHRLLRQLSPSEDLYEVVHEALASNEVLGVSHLSGESKKLAYACWLESLQSPGVNPS